MQAAVQMARRKGSGMTIVREPSGRLSRAVDAALAVAAPGEIKRLRDAALRGMADEEWGTELGRLFLTGKIDAVQYATGKKWGRLIVEYHRAIGCPPPYPKSGYFLDQMDKGAEPDPDSEEGKKRAKKARQVIDAMMEAHAVLFGAGKLAEYAVRAVCEANEAAVGEVGMNALSRGLDWLAEHWGLTSTTKRAYGR